DDYQLSKNLIFLAEVYEYLEQKDRALQAWHDAEEIAQKKNNNYLYLLGIAERTKGEIFCSKSEYTAAFSHFTIYCHYMARHNPLEYKIALRKVMDRLYETSRDEVFPLADALIQYWNTNQLAEKYPELIKACEEVKALVF